MGSISSAIRTSASRILFVAGVLTLATPSLLAASPDQETWLRFGGRLHPLLVHFPIALVLVAAMIEFWAMIRGKSASASARTCLGFGVAGGIFSCTSGWFYAENEAIAEALSEPLFWHRWGAIGVTSFCALVWALSFAASRQGLYRVFLMVGALGIGAIGHLGGDLTRGEDYLFEVFEKEDANQVAVEVPRDGIQNEPDVVLVSFRTEVEPLLEKHCYECHGPSRRKGNLRLDQERFAFPKNRDDWTIIPGDPENSLFIQRMLLPPDHRKFMPKKAEHPLPEEEIALLSKWIQQGAHYRDASEGAGTDEKRHADGNQRGRSSRGESALRAVPERGRGDQAEVGGGDEATGGRGKLAEGRSAEALKDEASGEVVEPTPESEARVKKSIEALRLAGVSVQSRSSESPDLDVDYSVMSRSEDPPSLELLSGLEGRLVELNLARTRLRGSDLEKLAEFSKLEKLNLSQTEVRSKDLEVLKDHPALKSLNLWGTSVDGSVGTSLEAMPALERVYLWRTEFGAEDQESLQSARPKLLINRGE